jgi:pimeloyl-ACP methyl ester carboxylesterase
MPIAETGLTHPQQGRAVPSSVLPQRKPAAVSRRGQSAPAPPPLPLLALEPMRAAIELVAGQFAGTLPRLGDGHPVIVYPGLAANGWSTIALRHAIDTAGFRSYDWRQGFNRGPRGDIGEWLAELDGMLREVHARHGRRVSLVGWSLGGIYARELAKHAPQRVRHVVTLGTPFGASPDSTHAGRIWRLLSGRDGALPPPLQRRLRECPPVPTTSIYSRSDGIVPWQGCLQPDGPQAENIAVDSASHLGMGTHPTVLRILVDRLAQPEGRWQRYAG